MSAGWWFGGQALEKDHWDLKPASSTGELWIWGQVTRSPSLHFPDVQVKLITDTLSADSCED